MSAHGVWKFVGELIKANLWEVLAIIGVTQIFLMPVIGASSPDLGSIVPGRLCHRPHPDLPLVQLLLRLRQAELAG